MKLTALISVSDKTGVIEFARALHALGVHLVSTGGTARLLADGGVPVTEVAELTGFPEMLDGRVKTLHPMVHGGLLARRDVPAHMQALAEHGIGTIDILCVNLYPFEQTVAESGCTLDDAIEHIDIGGPAMVRSGAKNWKDVTVLTDASQYDGVLAELRANGRTTEATRFALAVAASTASATTTPPSATTCPRCSPMARGPSSRARATAASSRSRTCATARTRTSRPPSTATCTRRPARW